MWATEPSIARVVILALALAGTSLALALTTGARAAPSVTEADIERASQRHRMPSEAEVSEAQGRNPPSLERLPRPAAPMPMDLEAIARGFARPVYPQNASVPRSGPKLLVFVSFAMPEATLGRLVDQAASAGATLVLRGLVNGSIIDTVARMRALIGNRKVDVQIDPQAFDRHGVVRTPTFVLLDGEVGPGGCATGSCPRTLRATKVAGDVSLGYALRHLTSAPRTDAHR